MEGWTDGCLTTINMQVWPNQKASFSASWKKKSQCYYKAEYQLGTFMSESVYCETGGAASPDQSWRKKKSSPRSTAQEVNITVLLFLSETLNNCSHVRGPMFVKVSFPQTQWPQLGNKLTLESCNDVKWSISCSQRIGQLWSSLKPNSRKSLLFCESRFCFSLARGTMGSGNDLFFVKNLSITREHTSGEGSSWCTVLIGGNLSHFVSPLEEIYGSELQDRRAANAVYFCYVKQN